MQLILAFFLSSSPSTAQGFQQMFPQPSTVDISLGEAIDCELQADDQKLLLLTSNGFGSHNAANQMVQAAGVILAFRSLVLQLPDDAWDDGRGAERKLTARSRSRTELEARNFNEPDLYAALDVVLMEDSCFLKESFWNEANSNFQDPDALTYKEFEMKTNSSFVKPYFRGLDQGWCSNQALRKPGFMAGLGFEESRVHHISMFDRLADESLKASILRMVAEGSTEGFRQGQKADFNSAEASQILQLLRRADVMFSNGGNPDFVTYIYAHYAKNILRTTMTRISSGQVIYIGRSAGSMVAGTDIGLTHEPKPPLLETLLNWDMTGLSLAGRCNIRPHFHPKWDLMSSVYGQLKNVTVVRISDGESLRCLRGLCTMQGVTSRQAPSMFTNRSDPQLIRLVDAFKPAGTLAR